MSVKSIVIANIAEFNRRAMVKSFKQNEIIAWDEASFALADMSLYWCGDDKVVILPCPPDESFLEDVKIALGYKNVNVVWPTKRSYSICEDIIKDRKLFEFLLKTIQDSNNPQIVSWGVTNQFYFLLDKLKNSGANYVASEVPKKSNYWTALYFESKAGFREFVADKLPTLKIPEGFICENKEAAIDAIAYFALKQRGFVLKANYGTGGFSTMCYPSDQLQRGFQSLQKDALHRMTFDNFWDNPPVIIEEHIPGIDGSFPSSLTINFIIHEDGSLTMKGSGKMVMRREWLYSGIHCGLGSLETVVENRIVDIGYQVGTQMAIMGYRGWFDIDFVKGGGNEIYLTEINARRASPIHVFDIGAQIIGDDWVSKQSLYANDRLHLQGSCKPNYSQIRKVFDDFNTKNNDFLVQAIPTIMSISLTKKTPYMGYVVLAQSASSASYFAIQLENQIKKAIGMLV
jgi:hypothetical protein